MTIKEIVNAKETLEDYIERMQIVIGVAPSNDYKVTIPMDSAMEIKSIMESYLKVINGIMERTEIECL